jgi:hypothetical protein
MPSNVRKPEAKERSTQMAENRHNVLIFRPYALQPGHKIHIDGGPRRGDWEVMEVREYKIKLRCPVSFREIECDHFYSFEEEGAGVPWPRHD